MLTISVTIVYLSAQTHSVWGRLVAQYCGCCKVSLSTSTTINNNQGGLGILMGNLVAYSDFFADQCFVGSH